MIDRSGWGGGGSSLPGHLGGDGGIAEDLSGSVSLVRGNRISRWRVAVAHHENVVSLPEGVPEDGLRAADTRDFRSLKEELRVEEEGMRVRTY